MDISKGRPFTLSRTLQFRNTECPDYTVKATKGTGGIAIEFCMNESNAAEYQKTGSRLINCTNCVLQGV